MLCGLDYEMFLVVVRFGERYEWPLLTQSIIMTITMLVMVRLCVTVGESGSVTHIQRRLMGKKEACLDLWLLFAGHYCNTI